MSTATASTDIALLSYLAHSAGVRAAECRRQGLTRRTKKNVSDLVTEADHAAEEHTVSTLLRLCPQDAVLGEEGTERRGSTGRYWTIDPVDGTFNFAHNMEYWCSAIALTIADPATPPSSSQDVTYGAVYQPDTDTLWVGGSDLPTTRNGTPLLPFGHPERPTPSSLAEACINTYLHPTFYDHPYTEVYAAWRRVITQSATYRMMGSASVDLASVAEGDTDLWIQHRLPAWDRLPGAALVMGVGGQVCDCEVAGERWTLAGAPHLVAEATELLRQESQRG